MIILFKCTEEKRLKVQKSWKVSVQKKFFVFFSIYDFLILVQGSLSPGSVNIFKFFWFERACRDAGHHRVLFLIKLYFLCVRL